MSKQGHSLLESILLRALALSPDDRGRFLEELSLSPEARAEIESLLKYATVDKGFLSDEHVPPGPMTLFERTLASLEGGTIPERIRGYRIIDLLGRGGMGIVYKAEQEMPRRIVALKIVRPALVFESLLERFSLEMDLLGKLHHPGIAQIFEGGIAQIGLGPQPFFAMEYIEGVDIIRHADVNHLGLREKLRLFVVVCDAVIHAHQKGIIHRDLKPDNILVDPDGRPKVLDFGVAGVLDSQGTIDVEPNEEIGLIGTLAYMSPEQTERPPKALDTRCDIYALGVILRELITGSLPFDLEGMSVAQCIDVIRREAPVPVTSIDPSLGGDLEAICDKAIAKEVDRRYDSVSALKTDIERHLRDEPVSVRVAPFGERTRRFARKNRALLIGSVVALSGLFLGLLGLALSYKASRDRSEQERVNLDLRLLRRDRDVVRSLEIDADTLWPRMPFMIAPIVEWLDEAKKVVGRFARHEALFERMTFEENPSDSHRREVNDERALIEKLETWSRGEGLMGEIEKRLQVAQSVEHETIGAHEQEWEQTIDEIAASAKYAGLEIIPQVGLVPLGPDPISDLFEFWVYETGSKPLRDPSTGRLKIDNETGMILVLLPAGRFAMGDEKTPHATPVHDVDLYAFFIGKCEVTQGQWVSVTNRNPSQYQGVYSSETLVMKDRALVHPVENLTWEEAQEGARYLGFDLPTEAQWEYACRAGTKTRWWYGDEPGSLEGVANLKDQSVSDLLSAGLSSAVDWKDRFIVHAPVASFRPNAFGLHDMHGNVEEWCREWFCGDVYATTAPRVGDGYYDPPENHVRRFHSIRGGSYATSVDATACAFRDYSPSGGSGKGVRLVRSLDLE